MSFWSCGVWERGGFCWNWLQKSEDELYCFRFYHQRDPLGAELMEHEQGHISISRKCPLRYFRLPPLPFPDPDRSNMAKITSSTSMERRADEVCLSSLPPLFLLFSLFTLLLLFIFICSLPSPLSTFSSSSLLSLSLCSLSFRPSSNVTPPINGSKELQQSGMELMKFSKRFQERKQFLLILP